MIIFTVITNYTGVYILKNHFFVKAAEINYLKSPKLVTFHQVKPYGYTNLKKIKNTYIYIYIQVSVKKMSFVLETPSGSSQAYQSPNTALKSLKSEIYKQTKKILKEISNLKKIPSSKSGWHFLHCTWIFLH